MRRRIGKFELQTKLGAGTMGTVWKSWDTVLGRHVALKFIAESLATTPEARRRFLRGDAQAAAILSHPNIATVHEAGDSEGELYITYEFIEGETVREKLKRGPLPLADAVRVARGLAQGLEHAHQKGVLHRDVKSGNVMVNTDGEGVLVDFGLARRPGASDVTVTGVRVGTVAYMAPEVLKGEEVDGRADLHSLGVVLYEMTTGHLPYDADQVEALQYQILTGDAKEASESRPEIPERLDLIINKLLETDVGHRYANAKDLVEDLLELEKGEQIANAQDAEDSTNTIVRLGKTARRRARKLVQKASRLSLASKTIAIAALAVTAYSIVGYPNGLWPFPPATPSITSVAVLPFSNMSPLQEETGHWADGIGSGIASGLANEGELRVLPWTTTRSFESSSSDPKITADELGVRALLTGTFIIEMEKLSCTVNLVDGESGYLIWSNSYKQPVTDILRLQESITTEVSSQLMPKNVPGDESVAGALGTEDVDAYEYYLLGNYTFQGGGLGSDEEAIGFYEKAIQMDPEYAEAYAGIGFVHSWLYFYGEAGMESLELATENFERALEVTPELSIAQLGLAKVSWEKGETGACLRLARSVSDRASRGDMQSMLAQATGYFFGGLAPKSVPIFERILEMDPANRAARWYLATSNAWARQYPEAIKAAEDFISLYGDEPEMYTWIGFSHHALGNLQEAIVAYEKALDLSVYESNFYVNIYAAECYLQLGNQERATEILQDGLDWTNSLLESHPDNLRMRVWRPAYYARLRDRPMFEEEIRIMKELEKNLAFTRSHNVNLFLGYAIIGDYDFALEGIRNMLDAESALTPINARMHFDIESLEELKARPDFKALMVDIDKFQLKLAMQY